MANNARPSSGPHTPHTLNHSQHSQHSSSLSSAVVLTAEQLAAAQKAAEAERKKKKEAKRRDKERKANEAIRVQGEAVQRLRDELTKGRLAICVGSGVTLYSAPTQAQRLSWWGLMSNALDYFEDQAAQLSTRRINKADLARARQILQNNDQTEADREDVANRIQRLLSHRIDLESTWLRAQFKNLYKDYVEQHGILDALKALQEQGAMLLTTNYDDLLEKHCKLDAIDASDPNGLISYRRGSLQAIFHPHGYWRNANHVVLSAEQYWRVKQDKSIQETLQHILGTKTVLFVGCGGGLSDPNFGPLIHWVGEKNLGTGSSHYILLQRAEENPVTQLPLIHLRCESFDDISRFLRDLLDPGGRREGLISEMPTTRERRRIHDWLAPVDQSRFLNDMLNLCGPGRFDRQVTMDRDVWTLNSPSRVRVKGKVGIGKTVFCASVIENTLKACRLGTYNRARDSCAYFFCMTYNPYAHFALEEHRFNLFLRTVISQLCPPSSVFAPLRALYVDCTRYHPARPPTNKELQDVLLQILEYLDKPPAPKKGGPTTPGETYLVIDELEALPTSLRSEYARFIKTLASQKLDHFHLLVTADNPLVLGLPPPGQLNLRGAMGLQAQRVDTDWYEVCLDLGNTGAAMLAFVQDCFENDPSFAVFGNILPWAVQAIHGRAASSGSFRRVYGRLQRLAQVRPTDALDDGALTRLVIDVLAGAGDGGRRGVSGKGPRKRQRTM